MLLLLLAQASAEGVPVRVQAQVREALFVLGRTMMMLTHYSVGWRKA
jgi:hypothetical protein